MALYPASSVGESSIALSAYRNTSVVAPASDGTAAKIGSIVIVNFCAFYSSATTGTTPCFTLPSEYKPSSTAYGSCTYRDANGISHVGQCAINTSGNIFLNDTPQILRMAGSLVFEV